MAGNDVEILREALARAATEPDAFYAVLDPDIEWDTTRQVPDGEVSYGIDSVRRFFRRWLGSLADYGFDAEEFVDAGDNVLVLLNQRAKGRGSGARVEGFVAQVWTLREGKVVRYRGFRDQAEARAAARTGE